MLLFFAAIIPPQETLFAQQESEKKKEDPQKSKPSISSALSDLFRDTSEKPKPSTVEVVADTLEYSRDHKKVIGKGNVVLSYQKVKILADYGEVETDTKRAYARGHVIFFNGEKPAAQGHEIYYDFENHTGSFPKGRNISHPWFSTGEDIQQLKEDLSVARNGAVTTCNLENPHYEIRAKKVTIHARDKMVAKNVTIYALGKPIFWLPYLVIPLRHDEMPLALSAGYNSRNGAYILASKGFSINESLGGKLHVDWRAKRGFGGGVDLGYALGHHSAGDFKGYWTQDKRAPTPPLGYEQLESRDRGRITLRHRTDIDDFTNIQLRYNRIADEFFLQDFFQKESRSDVEPQSFVTFTKNSDRYGFLTHVEKKMNSYESLVERLPEVRLDWKNQPFFNERVFYENQLSAANLSKRFYRTDEVNEDVVRVDNFHEWTVPLKWNEIKFSPLVNARGTYYSRERYSPDNRFRAAFGYGADLRTQYYKTFPVTFDKWGIELNHIRHLVEPFVRYESTLLSTVSDEELSYFDEIDRVDNHDIVTFGVENRLQTKRVVNGQIKRVDFVSLNTFLSYELNPDGYSRASSFSTFEDGRTTSNFTILTEEVILRPYEWLQAESRMDFDVPRGALRVLNQDVLVRKGRFRLLFGHRFFNDFPGLTGSNQFLFELSYTINALWQIGGYTRWDIQDDGLEEWQISASRDLHDFILDFGLNVRQSDIARNSKEVFFNFRMKQFPDYNLHTGSRASFSGPRIGETVAGANQISDLPGYFEQSFQVATRQ